MLRWWPSLAGAHGRPAATTRIRPLSPRPPLLHRSTRPYLRPRRRPALQRARRTAGARRARGVCRGRALWVGGNSPPNHPKGRHLPSFGTATWPGASLGSATGCGRMCLFCARVCSRWMRLMVLSGCWDWEKQIQRHPHIPRRKVEKVPLGIPVNTQLHTQIENESQHAEAAQPPSPKQRNLKELPPPFEAHTTHGAQLIPVLAGRKFKFFVGFDGSR